MLREDPQDGRVHDEVLQARRPVHRKIYLFHEDELMVVVPMMQGGVENVWGDMWGQQKELAVRDDVCLAVIRQFE